MYPPTSPLILSANRDRDARAPVASLSVEMIMTKAIHKLVPGRSNAINIPTRIRGLSGKTKTGKRRTNDMKCIIGRPAMILRANKGIDYLVELNNRPRPPMSNQQGGSLGVLALHLNKVNF